MSPTPPVINQPGQAQVSWEGPSEPNEPSPGPWRSGAPVNTRQSEARPSGPKPIGFWRSARFGVVLFLVLMAVLGSGPVQAAAADLLIVAGAVGVVGLAGALLRCRPRPASVLGSRALATLLFEGTTAWAEGRWAERAVKGRRSRS
jgi:hypothetical protein